jgi:hypothetical protein
MSALLATSQGVGGLVHLQAELLYIDRLRIPIQYRAPIVASPHVDFTNSSIGGWGSSICDGL